MQYNDNDLRKLQLLELRILKEIDRVCRELGITYFLDSGSVLGALRHGGFILRALRALDDAADFDRHLRRMRAPRTCRP